MSRSVTKTDDVKDGVIKHGHMMMVNGFRDFNTGAEDHFFFSQVTK